MPTFTDNLVQHLISEYGITVDDVDGIEYNGDASRVWKLISPGIKKMRPAVLGIIIVNSPKPNPEGKRSFKETLGLWDFSFHNVSGREMLYMLATATLVGMIHDFLAEDERRVQETYDPRNNYEDEDPCGDMYEGEGDEPHQTFLTEPPGGHNVWE
jgi:hypothetical protein